MTRGEIWWIDFGIPFGSEVGFRRPVVVLQNDILNASNLKTVIVVPLTTNTIYAEFSNNVFLGKSITKLPKDAVTQAHLMIHIDKNRFLEKVSRLDHNTIDKILKGVISTIS